MKNKSDLVSVHPSFSDLETSPIGLGMASLGRPGYINLGHAGDIQNPDYDAMRHHAFAMLDEAYALGVRYFDTAASYGAGERFLGDWIFERGFHVKGMTAASKWGYRYTADWKTDAEVHEVKDHGLDNLKSSFVWSCLHLGRAMKIYQIHSATFETGVLENIDVLNRLARIKEDGRLVGLTVSGPRQPELIEKAMAIDVDGERLFDVVQATWNLMETSASDALSEAKTAGMAVIIKEAMANGRLSERNTDKSFIDKLNCLKSQAEKLDCTLDALAIAAATNQPWSDIVLSGATTPEQLRSNVKALDVKWSDDAMGELSKLVELPAIYWKIRSELAWN